MSDVSMMGSTASAYTWQRPGAAPSLGAVADGLLDLTAGGWIAKLALGAALTPPSESNQGPVSGMAPSSQWIRREGMTAASHRDEAGSIAAGHQGSLGVAGSQLESLGPRGPALAEPKRQNVARALTPAERQALDEYVSQGKPPEQRAQAAERIACFIGTNGSALALDDLNLTRLPDIVKTLRLDTLDVSGNRLEELALPAEVAFLHVSRNALTAMPVLPEGTRMVFAADNRIREFHGPLPDTLGYVQAPNNMLDALPPFPASLVQFDIEGNTGKLTQAAVDARIRGPLVVKESHVRV